MQIRSRRLLVSAFGLAALGVAGAASCRPVPSPRAQGHDWRTYVNPRYRYSICYPADLLRPQAEPANGDGRAFRAADRATLSVFGRNAVDRATLARTVTDDAADLAGPRGRITYRVARPGWQVVSGDDGSAMLFYSKTVQRGDHFLSFELVYPKATRLRYAPVVERLARCFSTTG